MQIQEEHKERLVTITNHMLITNFVKSFSMMLQGYKLLDSFEVQRSLKKFIRILRRKNTEEGKIQCSNVEELAWREKQALIYKKKEENSIQNSQRKEELASLLQVMIESLKALDGKIDEVSELADKVKDKGKIEKIEDHEVMDYFGQDVFDRQYKQCILNRKDWTEDELIQQMKRYERITHSLTQMIIHISIQLAHEQMEIVQESKKKRRKLRRNDQ